MTTSHATLLALAHRRLELRDTIAAGDLEIEGDEDAVKRFVCLFTLPEAAPMAAA